MYRLPQETTTTALVGVGRWGRNLARELAQASNLVAYVSNDSPEGINWMSEHHPNITRRKLEEVLADKTIEAVVVATPISTHAEIGRAVLESGKHLFIEKPTTTDEATARKLVELAVKKERLIVTGYISLYHPCYRELARLIAEKKIKSAKFIWKKYGTFSEPIELNLLTHDLSIALGLFGEPLSIKTTRLEGSITETDILETELRYPDNLLVTSSIDRVSSEKQRLIEVTTENGETFMWDGPALRLKSNNEEREIFRDERQALTIEINEFLEAIKKGVPPPTAGDFGVKILSLHSRIQGLQ